MGDSHKPHSVNCPHGMPSRASCIDCMEDGPVAPLARRPAVAERIIEARYPGRCAKCGTAIEQGDDIGVVDGDWLCSLDLDHDGPHGWAGSSVRPPE